MRKFRIMILMFLFVVIGCATIANTARRQLDFVSYTKHGFPPHPSDYPVDLFFEGNPQKDYEVIGQITGFIVHDYNLKPVLEEKIRQVGGDGAVHIDIGTGHRATSSSGDTYHLNVFTGQFERVTKTNVFSYKVINLTAKVIKYKEMIQEGIPEGIEKLQSTWTEQEKYAFNLGRVASLGVAVAGLSKQTGQKVKLRAARELIEETFIFYRDSPEKLEGLHLAFEFTYDDFLTQEKTIIPNKLKKLEAIASNLPLFLVDLGWAYQLGVFIAFLDKIPEIPKSELDEGFPFNLYKYDSKTLEQLHWAYEWGYTHGKTYLLRPKD